MKIYDISDDFEQNALKRKPLNKAEQDSNVPVVQDPDAFDLIAKASSVFGITFKKQPVNSNILLYSLWDSFYGILELLLFIVSISSLHYIKMTAQISFTFHIYITLGTVMRFVLMSKRYTVFQTGLNICSLYRHLGIKAGICPIRLKHQITLFILWFVSMAVILSFYFYQTFHQNLKFKVLGFEVRGSTRIYALHFLRVSLIFSAISTTAITSIALMLCCNFYSAARNVLREFGEKFLEECRHKQISKPMLMSHMSTYKMIAFLYKQIDDSVSSSCLLLYAAAVCCFFNTLSVSLTISDLLSNWLVISHMMITLFMAIVIFFSLTITGSRANDEYESLNLKFLESAENIFSDDSCDAQVMVVFKMLTECVMNLQPTVTGWQMFSIRKSLILTTAGAMVTYGVLIFQLP